jgi:hypothetical protein
MATVVLPRSLVALVNGSERRSEVDGATVGDVLAALDARWPGLLDRVCDPGPILRRHQNGILHGERAAHAPPQPPGSPRQVIPAVSGGSRRPG